MLEGLKLEAAVSNLVLPADAEHMPHELFWVISNEEEKRTGS